jgi:hypothetical protein
MFTLLHPVHNNGLPLLWTTKMCENLNLNVFKHPNAGSALLPHYKHKILKFLWKESMKIILLSSLAADIRHQTFFSSQDYSYPNSGNDISL